MAKGFEPEWPGKPGDAADVYDDAQIDAHMAAQKALRDEGIADRSRRIETIKGYYGKPFLPERRWYRIPEIAKHVVRNGDSEQRAELFKSFVLAMEAGLFRGRNRRSRIFFAQPDPEIGVWLTERFLRDRIAVVGIDDPRGKELLERLLKLVWMPRDLVVPWLGYAGAEFHIPEWFEVEVSNEVGAEAGSGENAVTGKLVPGQSQTKESAARKDKMQGKGDRSKVSRPVAGIVKTIATEKGWSPQSGVSPIKFLNKNLSYGKIAKKPEFKEYTGTERKMVALLSVLKRLRECDFDEN